MVRKKVDPRVRELIEAGVKNGHRSMFIMVGDHGKDQVENLHKILAKTRVKSRPSVLWCYKKELGFSTHRQKRMRQIKKMQARGLHDPDQEDPFDLFISTTNIRWAYYKETDKILGQTFGMVVLQDFEGLTPNILARTIETVEGGGLVVLLLRTVKSLKQLYTMTMDVHSRFRTEACHEVVPRFNERFILSLADCSSCLVLDDELNVLPISSGTNSITSTDAYTAAHGEGAEPTAAAGEWESSVHTTDPKLVELKASLEDTPTAGSLVGLAKTLDQAQAILSFLDAISEKSLRSTVALTAARGRGKSASIGLCLAGAIAYGYSNIFVTAPSPENLKTVFDFVLEGLKVLKYVEHLDFEAVQENMGTEVGKVVVRINIFREHRQTIQYIAPNESYKLAQAELVAIDEAAAIPLPTIKALLGNYLVFISSTVNGYEGTGRALSLKLISQLRQMQHQLNAQAAQEAGNALSGSRNKLKGEQRLHEERWKLAASTAAAGAGASSSSAAAGAGGSARARVLTELSLETPIRYNNNDAVESWLNALLCLDVVAHSTRIVSSLPAPKDCDLYLVDRDALFSYHPLSEKLLQRIWSLYTAAHYKNTPNDLQMLSDAPAHRLFVLLGPQRSAPAPSGKSGKKGGDGISLPDILCVVQVAFEGRISQQTVQSELAKGNKTSGDMIPWTICQQFNDNEFASLSGARIVRVAAHSDVQNMGYGSRAVELLLQYFSGDVMCMNGNLPTPPIGVFGGESGGRLSSSDPTAAAAAGDDAASSVRPRAKLPPLLTALHERPAERLHWLGVSFGVTAQLLNFWTRKAFKMMYLRQTANEITGEYSCILIREMRINESYGAGTAGSHALTAPTAAPSSGWLRNYVEDYRHRLVHLLAYSFRKMDVALAMALVDPDRSFTAATTSSTPSSSAATSSTTSSPASSSSNFVPLTTSELLSGHLTMHDVKRLELYSRNMVDHHMIMDLLPTVARLVFLGRFNGTVTAQSNKSVEGMGNDNGEAGGAFRFSHLQVAVLVAMGLQHKDVDAICSELDLPSNQVLAFFNKTLRKITAHIRSMLEASVVGEEMVSASSIARMEARAGGMKALAASLAQEQKQKSQQQAAGAPTSAVAKQQQEIIMGTKDLSQHALPDDAQLGAALETSLMRSLQATGGKVPTTISISSSSAGGASSKASTPAPKGHKDQSQQPHLMSSHGKSAGKKRPATTPSAATAPIADTVDEDGTGENEADVSISASGKKKSKKHKKHRLEE